ncbi:MAG TPA: hypothetical protein PKB02_03710 [Anaerohalosphaeraceae bacterium]|nr:hypothetical protein [Anaerohalosphaeraceae bacterium]
MKIHYLQPDPKGPDGPGLTDTGFVSGYFSCDAGQQWRCKNSRGIFLMPRTRTATGHQWTCRNCISITGQTVNQTAMQQQPDAALAPGRKEGISKQAPQGPECRAPPHMAVPVNIHIFTNPALFEPTNKTTMYNNLKDNNDMDNNPIYDKLKKELLQEVQPLLVSREQARQRMVDIHKQIKDFQNQAAEAKAKANRLDTELTKVLIDDPDKAAAVQKKIQKALQEAKDASESGDRLEGQLQPIDAELRSRENAVSVAVCQRVIEASKEYSETACRQFLDLYQTYFAWVQAVNALRSDLKASGLDGLHSHRLRVVKAVQTIPYAERNFWFRIMKNIESDFSSVGSHTKDTI